MISILGRRERQNVLGLMVLKEALDVSMHRIINPVIISEPLIHGSGELFVKNKTNT